MIRNPLAKHLEWALSIIPKVRNGSGYCIFCHNHADDDHRQSCPYNEAQRALIAEGIESAKGGGVT
jgi:hypothetical protein